MSALTLHLFGGLVAGTRFGVQTILVLALMVLLEGVACSIINGAYAGFMWLLIGQCALQFGYLGGIYLRSILERASVAARSGGRSSGKHIRDVWPS
jgi:hypothetical protein